MSSLKQRGHKPWADFFQVPACCSYDQSAHPARDHRDAQDARDILLTTIAVLLLAVSTGMRLGEIVGLEPGDIDFQGSFIEVRRSLVLGRMETPKNGKTRRVGLCPEILAAVLKSHIAHTKARSLCKGAGEKMPPTLFYNQRRRSAATTIW